MKRTSLIHYLQRTKQIQQEEMNMNLKDEFKNTRARSNTNKIAMNNDYLSESESYSQNSRHIQGLYKQFKFNTKLGLSQTIIIAMYRITKARCIV